MLRLSGIVHRSSAEVMHTHIIKFAQNYYILYFAINVSALKPFWSRQWFWRNFVTALNSLKQHRNWVNSELQIKNAFKYICFEHKIFVYFRFSFFRFLFGKSLLMASCIIVMNTCVISILTDTNLLGRNSCKNKCNIDKTTEFTWWLWPDKLHWAVSHLGTPRLFETK